MNGMHMDDDSMMDGHAHHGSGTPGGAMPHVGHLPSGDAQIDSAAGSHVGHGSHTGNGDMSHGMPMSFYFGYAEEILFKFWKAETIGALIGSMIGIFLMAMLYEGLKVLREYLLQRSLLNETSRRSDELSRRSHITNGLRVPLANETGDTTPDGSTSITDMKSFLRPHPFSTSHVVQTLLHMLQQIVSYLLMLIFMTYNVWLALAVVLGAGAGYFVFGWRKKTIIDINEHCH